MENSINKNLRICKKCLTRDMIDKADYFKSMYDYIENLDPDIKTEDSLYEKRLATCKECERLAEVSFCDKNKSARAVGRLCGFRSVKLTFRS